MPKEANSKAPNRWEGTHTYTRNQPRKRTVAQIREEAAARIKADREKRREGVEKLRRNSIAGFPVPGTSAEHEQEEQEEPGIEEVFFDANGEEMPGSNKKKKPPSPSIGDDSSEQGNTAGNTGVDPAMLELLMSIKRDINETTKSEVEKVDKRIDQNSKAIEKIGADTASEIRKLRQHCQESHDELEKKIEKKLEDRDTAIERRLATLETQHKPRPETYATKSPLKQQEAYSRARRTLKIWPVAGQDLEDAVKVFMRTKLKIDDQRITSIGNIQVKQSMGRAAKDRSEVLAMFETREDRDYVKSMGVNLANMTGIGVSIHVPGHLLDNYYALSSIGYNIRQNQDGVKRSIKYNDSLQNLHLDIYIGGKWKRILPDEARAALKAAPGAIGAANNTGISAADLVSLVSGEAVPGITAVEVPADDNMESTE